MALWATRYRTHAVTRNSRMGRSFLMLDPGVIRVAEFVEGPGSPGHAPSSYSPPAVYPMARDGPGPRYGGFTHSAAGGFFPRIHDVRAPRRGEGRQPMLDAFLVEDVPHGPGAHRERVGQELAMAAPGHRFRTHERDALRAGQLLQFGHDGLEGRGQHEIRVGAKGAHAPTGVGRGGRRRPEASQVLAPHVPHARGDERRGQGLPREV